MAAASDQPLCGSQVDTAKMQLRRAVHLKRLTGPRAEDDPDRLVCDSADGERHRVHRLSVQTVRIIDDDQEWLTGGRLGQQRKHSCIHSERVGRAIRSRPERDLDRPRLTRGQRSQASKHRSDELIKARVRQRRLCRHPAGVQPLHLGCLSLGVPEQRSLANSGLAEHDERTTSPAADLGQQPVDPGTLAGAANQHDANLTDEPR